MSDPNAPIDLDPSFMTALPVPSTDGDAGSVLDVAPAPAPPVEEAPARLPRAELPYRSPSPGFLSDKAAKHVDPASPVVMRMMAARAVVPMPPKELVPLVYQLMWDVDDKVALAARQTFEKLDDRLVNAVVSEPLPGEVLEAFCRTMITRPSLLEKVLLNRRMPDAGFVHVAAHVDDARILSMVTENQERLLRCHDIVRAVRRNPKALRSDLDRCIDFLVREGVFLEDVPEFEDSFLRLGKNEMLEAVKKIKIGDEHLSSEEKQKAASLGMSADQFLRGEEHEALNEEQLAEVLEALEDEGDTKKKKERSNESEREPLSKKPVPVQIALAMTGSHTRAVEALASTNRLVASAGIRNPKVKENDVVRISRSKQVHEDVIRYICNNVDWTKSYAIKLNLVQNPKTPNTLAIRWMSVLRQNDLRQLAKSKQVPSYISVMARRLLSNNH